jgi:hypothetical protein
VSDLPKGDLTFHHRRCEDGADPRLLDVVTIQFLEARPQGCQKENHLIDSNSRWIRAVRINWDEFAPAVDHVVGTLWINGHSSGNGTNDKIPEKVAAAKEFVSPRRTGQIGRAFLLAAAGNLDDSIEEFEDAAQDGEVDALAYRDYVMVMIVHGRISRAYFCSRHALALDPKIRLHPVLGEVLRDYLHLFNRDGMPNQQSVEAFTRLRVQYIRSKGI